jgi:hypothetical protein
MPLREFRERLYGCLDKRVDALFELIDGVLTSGHVTSPVHLSLATAHRRSWVSLYAALGKGRIDAEAVRDLLVEQIQGDGLPENAPQFMPWTAAYGRAATRRLLPSEATTITPRVTPPASPS